MSVNATRNERARVAQAAASPLLPSYIRLVVTCGIGVIFQSLFFIPDTPYPLAWLLFTALAVATGTFTMKIASVDATISVTDTFFISSAMLFGPGPATVTVAIDSFVASWRRGHRWNRIAFNTAACAFAMWTAGHVFFWLAGTPPLARGHQSISIVVIPLLCLTATYFLLNSGLTAVAIGLQSRQSPLHVWRHHFLWLSLGFLAAGSVSFCLILLIQQVSLMAMALILPLLVIFHLTLRSSFGRLEDAQHHLVSMDRMYLSTIETLAMAIDAKDDVTHSHVRRVQAYAMALADALGISDDPTLKAIEAAALLHDTGKLAVPEHILNKPGGLTPSEFDQMKLHVDVGADILSRVDFPYPVVPIVRGHHENWDGTGYPRGLKGTDIPIGARILSVVDCFDALTSDRPYRGALSNEAAIEILLKRRGTMYDPQAVDAFIAIHRDVKVNDLDAPEHRDALNRISQSPVVAPAPPALAESASAPASSDVLAFVSLARLASGQSTMADVLALASKLIRDVVPGVTAAWYILDGSEALALVEAVGPAADGLRGMRMPVGERLSGWVAANRQPIVNSEAALDLGARAHSATPPLQSCMSTPLLAGESLAGVLSLYASDAQAFTDDQSRLVQMIAPHLAQALVKAKRVAAEPQVTGTRDLRLVRSA